MKQEDFDKKVEKLNEKVGAIDASLETESGEIKQNFTALRDEIARLKESQGANIDTSKLDEIGDRLESSAARISGLVDPLPGEQTPPIVNEPAPAPTVDPIEPAKEDSEAEVPAARTESETTVTTKTEDAEGNKSEEEVTTAEETSTAEAEADTDGESAESKDEE